VAGCCKCGNEPSGSIKSGEFLEDLLASQEGLCSMELNLVSVDLYRNRSFLKSLPCIMCGYK